MRTTVPSSVAGWAPAMPVTQARRTRSGRSGAPRDSARIQPRCHLAHPGVNIWIPCRIGTERKRRQETGVFCRRAPANANRRCAASSNPVSASAVRLAEALAPAGLKRWEGMGAGTRDRKSTRLNSSHGYISYAVFCLKKKKKKKRYSDEVYGEINRAG